MMINNVEIDNLAICSNLKRLINQVYKLLPNREENIDWENPLKTIIEEFAGMVHLMPDQQEIIFSLMCKLEGLFTLNGENDFFEYRRTIFECLNLIQEIKTNIEEAAQ